MDRHTIGNGIIDGTLVKMELTGNCSALTTYSRKHGRSRRFLIYREHLDDLWNGAKCFDDDIYGFLSVRLVEAELRLRITWLNGSDERVYGHVERISIPFELWDAHLRDGSPIRHLHRENRNSVKLDFSGASRTIRDICGKKRIKRAFLKGIPRNFQWKYGKTIRFFNDGGCNFFFREEGRGLCGGFILHRDAANKKQKQEERAYYSVHT